LTRRFANHETANMIGGCTSTFPAASMPAAITTSATSYSRRREERRGVLSDHDRGRADEKAEVGTLIGPAVPYGEVADVSRYCRGLSRAACPARRDFIDTVKRLGVEPFKERVYATR